MSEIREANFTYKCGGAKGIAFAQHEVGAKKPILFLLKAGSVVKTEPSVSYKEIEDGYYVLKEDIKFTSPSTAANFVSNSSVDGQESWFSEDDRTYRDVFEVPKIKKGPYSKSKQKEEEASEEDVVEIEESIYPVEKRINIATSDKKEYVYVYYFPSRKELATLKGEKIFPHKIGKADNDAVARISQQILTSNFEEPRIALIVECDDCTKLEKALHDYFKVANRWIQLKTGGIEWYNTNSQEVESYVQLLKGLLN